jgi:magnesium-transporting ATPase (P-type)
LILSNINYIENQYAKYEDCFVQTLRDGEWVKIQKNLLVEGDYIKINVGEAACADVSCIDYRYVSIAKEKKWISV